MELFPTIVSRAKTIEVISSGGMGSQSGTLQLVIFSLKFGTFLVCFFYSHIGFDYVCVLHARCMKNCKCLQHWYQLGNSIFCVCVNRSSKGRGLLWMCRTKFLIKKASFRLHVKLTGFLLDA